MVRKTRKTVRRENERPTKANSLKKRNKKREHEVSQFYQSEENLHGILHQKQSDIKHEYYELQQQRMREQFKHFMQTIKSSNCIRKSKRKGHPWRSPAVTIDTINIPNPIHENQVNELQTNQEMTRQNSSTPSIQQTINTPSINDGNNTNIQNNPPQNLPDYPHHQHTQQPIVQPIVQPMVQPIVQPVVQPIVQPIVQQPIEQPVTAGEEFNQPYPLSNGKHLQEEMVEQVGTAE